MIRIFVTTLLIVTVYGNVIPKESKWTADSNDGKIVGGEDAQITDAPYQVAMLYSRTGASYFLSCGGSIIRSDVILCAAHCTIKSTPSNWKVRAGSSQSDSGGQLADVKDMIVHYDHNEDTKDYDIGLYILASSLILDGITTKAIPLPVQDAPVADNAEALITGWGSIKEGGLTVTNLQKATIPIVNQELCIQAYAESTVVTPRMICAGLMETGGKDTCQGDSGGPLVVDGVLIGITAWGRGCARPGFPGVSTRVPAFRDWIEKHMP